MGVKGFHTVLQEEGYVPDETGCPCCSTSLWRDARVMHNCPLFAAKVSMVKRRSTLFIDGTGLAFHLHRVAYARHAAHVLLRPSSSTNITTNSTNTNGTSTTNSKSPCSAKHLTPEQVTKLLPNLLPLTVLDEVTREFVETLQTKHQMKLVVYLDGSKRRDAKKETDVKRGQRRPAEWSAFQQYCCNGIMPSVDRVCQWEDKFPKNRLFLTQVKYTLAALQVETVFCTEEADAELARQAAKTPNSYVVGQDSDFCFFPKARYIPLQTLHADSSVVTASVISRKELTSALSLPNEAAMVELAILLGNDYVGSFSSDKFEYNGNRKAAEIMDHLRAEGDGYRVTSASGDETETAIRFTRMFYALENLDEEFPLALSSTSPPTTTLPGQQQQQQKKELVEDEPEANAGLTMKLPRDFPIEMSLIQPQDTSLKGALVRCLTTYLEQQQKEKNDKNNSDDDDKAVFHETHLTALKQMSSARRNVVPEVDGKSRPWKPQWEDVPACYLIESCMAYSLNRSRGLPQVRLSPPGKVFDCFLFHQTLFQLRNPNESPKRRSGSINSNPGSPRRKESNASQKKFQPRDMLPIDEHEERIISHINNNRVTIIQGETGCGKSTRVPIMVMKAAVPDPALREVRLFISQPRRIAAKSLVERLRATEPELGKTIALRMGHGVREYETSATRAVFCTTGYLVRILSNHPEKFNRVSHLIIDEIHERSVDTDILCLLCRRLLDTNPHIRLVLMSATLAAKLYQDYFDIAEPPIIVGARRFPIDEIFVEDLPSLLRLPPKELKAVKQIEKECNKTKCITAPSNSVMESLYNVAARIAITVGQPGSSVLIFVPGMRDIEGISEIIEKTYVPGVTFTCIPVHSDIPFEDQMTVFDESEEVKIIIATNAAESSLTIPDCDHVICTGLQKQITYNASSHRQMLSPCWISRASARQRSGRVGRVRPGTVYRLYTREAYESMMKEFESGEMLRMPLDSVILMLKEILTEATTPALLDCLEPPDLSTIERSYESLYTANFVTQPDDEGDITTLGAFVSALGIDLTLGALIGLGIQFGVGPEAIELAAVLSFPKSPWIMSNPLVHKPKSFNSGTSKTYASKNHFDAGLFSEPLATMNLIYEYNQLHGSRLSHFCQHHGVHNTRIRRLISTRNNLLSRVADFQKIDWSLLKVTVPPSEMHHSKLTILRTIIVWTASEIIEYKPMSSIKKMSDGPFAVPIKTIGGVELEDSHLENLFRKDHSYILKTQTELEQNGFFVPVSDEAFDLANFLIGFEGRFVSYTVDNNLDLAWFWFENGLQLYASSSFSETSDFQKLLKLWSAFSIESTLYLSEVALGNRRGRGERPCGRWSIQDPSEANAEETNCTVLKIYTLRDKGLAEGINSMLRDSLKKGSSATRVVSFDFSRNVKRKKKGNNVVVHIFCCGGDVQKVSDTDLCDLLAVPKQRKHMRFSNKRESCAQSIVFDYPDIADNDHEGADEDSKDMHLSTNFPILQNAPEGARLLSILAASRRREATVQIPLPVLVEDEDSEAPDDDELICFSLDRGLGRLTNRWTRLGSDKQVFVTENSVPASIVPIGCTGTLYACCANTLELRGGGIRADGLTVLPTGSNFLLLSFLTFNRTPDGLGSVPADDAELDEFIGDALFWVSSKDADFADEGTDENSDAVDWSSRMRMCVNFARSTENLGYELVCFPEKVKELCAIFDGVDGYSTEVWPTLESDPFIPKPENEQKFLASLVAEMRHPSSFYEGYNSDKAADDIVNNATIVGGPPGDNMQSTPQVNIDVSARKNPISLDVSAREKPEQEEKKSKEGYTTLRGELVHEFSEDLCSKSRCFFAPAMPIGVASLNDMPTTNIIAICVKHVHDGLIFEATMQQEKREDLLAAAQCYSQVRLIGSDQWVVRHFVDHNGKDWYQALFSDSAIPLRNRPYRESPKWARFSRPWVAEQATLCAPPHNRSFVSLQTEVYEEDDTKRKAVLFDNIETALQMEAAFFLDRHLCAIKKHWYELSFQELMHQLSKRVLPTSQILELNQLAN